MHGTEVLLVLEAARGDRGAFRGLVEAHWTRLVALARSVVGDLEAEDAVQEGFVDAWRKLGRLRDPSAFRAWLTRIVLRRCLKRARRIRFHVPLEEAPEVAAEASPPDLDVPALLARLAPRQRAVMHLTLVEELSDSEIAHLLHITAASVRSHRRRARERLRQSG
ncbi:MAG: sigma-70 family RNA polymerase sigma factor, partial [Acidobacteria bacterium]|nr:sigma-70 family RNA polymerase sigma factor [Acidobacteriota bacterium]